MTNHEELRRLATEATPGPWTIHTEEVCSPIVAAMELSKLVHGSVFVPVLPMVVGSNGLATAVTGCGPTSVANAAYIAATSPDVVLGLLGDIDRLTERTTGQLDIRKYAEQLHALITKLHAAKGRYHTQQACCDLFDLVGLKNERPVK